MDNVTLIGMPGCGKSSIGVVLAKVLGYQFVDSDLLIQHKEGKLLHEIITQEGLDTFISIEEEVNASIEGQKQVIATGGSVVYGARAMEHLKEISRVVYIKVSIDELKRRLGDLHRRGVVLKEGQTLDDLYHERCPLYEKYADITVEAQNMSMEQVLAAIIEELNK